MPKPKLIPTPEILYEHFEKYKEYAKSNPKQKQYFSPKSEQVVTVDMEVPLTWNGFEIYLRQNGIIQDMEDYEKNDDGRYGEYAPIIRAIKKEIYQDKYVGAAVGQFQHNIIARDLGLIDKKEQHNINPEPIQIVIRKSGS